MKKYKTVLDVVLLGGLAVLSLLAIAPKTVIMPSSLQMLFLAVVLGLIASFLALMWREKPSDEREAHNQAQASRLAYIVGVCVLIVALIVESLQHTLDPAIPLALLAMITVKIVVQISKDD